MRVSEILTLKDYYRDIRFRGRANNLPSFFQSTNRWVLAVLITDEFFYFGANAVGTGFHTNPEPHFPVRKVRPQFPPRLQFCTLAPTLIGRWDSKDCLAAVIQVGFFRRSYLVRPVINRQKRIAPPLAVAHLTRFD
jgi:hypothetical protein